MTQKYQYLRSDSWRAVQDGAASTLTQQGARGWGCLPLVLIAGVAIAILIVVGGLL